MASGAGVHLPAGPCCRACRVTTITAGSGPTHPPKPRPAAPPRPTAPGRIAAGPDKPGGPPMPDPVPPKPPKPGVVAAALPPAVPTSTPSGAAVMRAAANGAHHDPASPGSRTSEPAERGSDVLGAARASWSPARRGDTPGQLAPGEDDTPLPIVAPTSRPYSVEAASCSRPYSVEGGRYYYARGAA